MPKVKPVTLDGSTLEGGGQLVRVALSISAIIGVPVHIHSIRANRAPHGRYKSRGNDSIARSSINHHDKNRRKTPGPSDNSGKVEGGLKESHLAALIWLGQQVNAFIDGGKLSSRELTFVPGAAKPSNTLQDSRHLADQNTIKLERPGSVFLILQAIFPYLVFGSHAIDSPRQALPADNAAEPLSLILHGGTNVPKSMSAEYVSQVFAPVLSRLGFPAPKIEIVRRGWAGAAPQVGEVKVIVPRRSPSEVLPTHFHMNSRGSITKIDISVVAYPDTTRDTLISTLSKKITESFRDVADAAPEIEVLLNDDSGDERRLYILLVAHTSHGWVLGRDFLGSGRRAKTAVEATKIIDEACTGVVKELVMEIRRGGCVDEHMSDQLGVFQALTAYFAARAGQSQHDGGMSVVNAGDWGAGRGERTANEQYSGDDVGSLHARTVRWVCESMMKEVKFAPGGACNCAILLDKSPRLDKLSLEDEE